MKREAHGAQEPRHIFKICRGYEHRATKRLTRTGNYSRFPREAGVNPARSRHCNRKAGLTGFAQNENAQSRPLA